MVFIPFCGKIRCVPSYGSGSLQVQEVTIRIQFDPNGVLPIRSSTRILYNRGAQMTHRYPVSRQKIPRVCAIAARQRPSTRPTEDASPRGLSRRVHTTRAVVSRARIPSADRRDRPPERSFGPARVFTVKCEFFQAWSVYRYTTSDCFHRQIH